MCVDEFPIFSDWNHDIYIYIYIHNYIHIYTYIKITYNYTPCVWHPKSILFGSDLFGRDGNLQILQLANLAMCQNRPLSLSVSLKHVKTVGDFVQTGVFFVAPNTREDASVGSKPCSTSHEGHTYDQRVCLIGRNSHDPPGVPRRLRALKLLTQTGRPVAERNWLGKEGKRRKMMVVGNLWRFFLNSNL